MPTATGRTFTTANFLTNLAALKAINFGSGDPAGTWFVVPNSITSNVEIWIWQPDSMVAADEISVVRPDSIVPGSPGRCVQRLKFDPGGTLAAIAALTTTGLIERIAGGGVSTATVSSFIKTFLDDIDQSTARTTLGLGAAAIRGIGTSTGTIRDAADAAYTNARTPTAHVATHAVGGADALTIFSFLAVTVSSTLAAANQRQLINADATGGAITITLPAAATVGSGWAVQIRKSDASANLVTISRSGTDLINGVATLPLAVQHQSFILFSLGGTSWGVVAGFDGTLPANSLIGRGATAGLPEVIPNTFVNITTEQEVGGSKRFLEPILVGLNSDLSIKSYTTLGVKVIPSTTINAFNHINGEVTFTANPTATFGLLNLDLNISSSTTITTTPLITSSHIRVRNYSAGLTGQLQGLRLVALNSGVGNVTTLDGGSFVGRNDTATTVTTINGGNFVASIGNVAGTATTVNAGLFTASSGASALSTTIRGVLVNASSLNTTPATDCVGVDITSITGTATNKLAIRTGLGRVLLGDTTQSTSTTTGALVLGAGGGIGCPGNIYAGGSVINFAALPTSATGLAAGSLWRNGTVVNIV